MGAFYFGTQVFFVPPPLDLEKKKPCPSFLHPPPQKPRKKGGAFLQGPYLIKTLK